MKCKATTSSGHQCDSNVMAGKEHCNLHDPETLEERRQSTFKNHEIHKNKIIFNDPLVEPEALRALMGLCIQQTVALNFDPKVLAAISAACSVQIRLIELVDISNKIKRLEEIAKGDFRLYSRFEQGAA